MTKRVYGHLPDPQDPRDLVYPKLHRLHAAALAPLFPATLSWRSKLPPRGNQGQLGDCTAFATELVYRGKRWELGNQAGPSSHLAGYWQARKDQGTVNHDSGATLRGAMKAWAEIGLIPEPLWPYNIKAYRQQPSAAALAEGQKHLPTGAMYMSVPKDRTTMKAILSAGNLIAYGQTVWESFEMNVGRDGIYPVPGQNGDRVAGGHAICIIGWDDTKQASDGTMGCWEVANSWGQDWGDEGHFWIGYGQWDDAASDPWTAIQAPA